MLVEYYQYYDGLTDEELYSELIVKIEAAWYCDSYGKKFIRYSPLRRSSNESSIKLTKNEISSGTFASIVSKLSNPSIPKKDRIFTRRYVKARGNEESRIYPNIPLIQKEIKRRQAENLSIGNKRLIRIISNIDHVQRHRSIFESVGISESVDRQVNKSRSPPIESVKISEKLSMTVTHAHRNHEYKKI
jgi:hypothetical protein